MQCHVCACSQAVQTYELYLILCCVRLPQMPCAQSCASVFAPSISACQLAKDSCPCPCTCTPYTLHDLCLHSRPNAHPQILDNIRRTNVQDGEAGGITQQIGATFIPAESVEKRTEGLRSGARQFDMKLPGVCVCLCACACACARARVRVHAQVHVRAPQVLRYACACMLT